MRKKIIRTVLDPVAVAGIGLVNFGKEDYPWERGYDGTNSELFTRPPLRQ